ncbi:unnamed protein product [Didymodactylos carnosus]|uniref:AAA+ ATPase domain-containing protein n=1 Tax=Didymodactylos carnosus TaxID=1234261 RepID=A0A813NXZ6_9BILA|nr:unnamed protein product [Didymodactylos carnosus]CAF3520855.1 unnamed protein product [Didymodactylos carnosus]
MERISETGGVSDASSSNDNKPTDNKSFAGRESVYKFDSTALERAATAAKVLERSQYATQAFDVVRLQEQTKQLEIQKQMKEYSQHEEAIRFQHQRQLNEEKRRTMEIETQKANERARFQDQLARKRMQDQQYEQARVKEEERRRQEESVEKQENTRQRSIEYAEQVRHQYEMKRLEAELKGKAQIERENRELYLEQIKLKAEQERKTVLEGIKTAGSVVGQGITTLLESPSKVLLAAGGITLLALGIYTTRGGTQTAVKYIESRLGKPPLIRETSRTTFLTPFRAPFKTIRHYFTKAEDSLKGVVLDPMLESHLREIAIATRFTKKNRGLFRNLLMHGPPGTGKTLFAKKLAAHSGLDYAIMTGGDVAPLGRDAVTAIHKVFDWSQTSRRGLLLFIDEADAFLKKRATEKISEDMRAALNAFLYRTGEQSTRFMMVLASNEPEQFDWAVNDRLDEMVQFNLPSIEERRRMTYLYFDSYILQSAERKRKIKIDSFDFEKKCEELAQKTDGFSGREIAKLLAACQATAYASEDGTLTEAMIDTKLRYALDSHVKKVAWRAEEER